MRDARKKPAYRSARTFFLILALGLVLALCITLQSSWHGSEHRGLHSRDIFARDNDEDTCRHVHLARDQCKFIKKHCPTDEAGFSTYLDLYFCRLPNLKPLVFIILTAWLGVLFSTIGIAASDFFCVDLSTMAKILGMSESMAGVTLLAFGNGSPDVFSTFAAMNTDSGDLAVGELMGAAGFITAVVAGSMALIKPFKVSKKSFVRDVCFFAVAAAFTMVILADGILKLWECFAMIAYYVFYVLVVISWHWYEIRRRKRLEKEAAARGHYAGLGDEDGIDEPYRDDPDESTLRTPLLRAPSGDDFAALERVITDTEADADYDDDERARFMSELNANTRLSRPGNTRLRSATIAPVRPSLVGALEFQAVLKSLKKDRNMRHIPLHSRRYSDDPNLTAFDLPGQATARRRASVRAGSPSGQRPDLRLNVPQNRASSPSAYTAREAPAVTLDDELQWRGQSHAPIHEQQSNALRPGHVSFVPPAIEVSHPSPSLRPVDAEELGHSTGRPSRSQHSVHSDDLIAHRRILGNLNSPNHSPNMTPRRGPQIFIPTPPRSRSSTRSSHTKSSPFPAFHQEALASEQSLPQLALPPPVIDQQPEPSEIEINSNTDVVEERPSRWKYWPYRVLPSPESLGCVLFPTISDWEDKSIWARALGMVAAPSVFLLTITLPVVESETEQQDFESPLTTQSMLDTNNTIRKSTDTDEGSLTPRQTPRKSADVLEEEGLSALGNAAGVAVSQDASRPTVHDTETAPSSPYASAPPVVNHASWPRWLLLIQLYVAPLTIVLAVWVQTPEEEPVSWLITPMLICLLISTVLLIPILLTTTPTYRPPQYRILLSLVGFAVSIAWISTIASQVVGTLKALAIILNWSNAIMGLTVFAVGNSVGDLVADVTVANLGYPVMALSACFAAPMLNILLGIGLSGTYSILHGASRRKHKHPEKGYKIRDYHLDVGRTLLVSGVALLVTLVGVLVLVPLNKWMMTRKIGTALIVLWIVATICNVVVEVTGLGDVSMLG